MQALRRVVASVSVAALVFVPASAGDQNLIVGVTDDAFLAHSADAVPIARDLGLQAVRVALVWSPGQTALEADDAARLDELVAAAQGLRIVLTPYGRARAAPLDDVSRDQYCAYVADVLTRYPSINDVVIWNEPNLSFFWQPQFDANGQSAAPAAYEALLARCWDVLHAVRPGVNVIMGTSPGGNDNPLSVSNVSHSPPTFIRKVGEAYRASRRARRIFDTVGHNPYGESSAEDPWQTHLGPWHVAEGDVDRLVQALEDGFAHTAQPIPGSCGSPCVSIWYLEAGYQTVPDEAHNGYTGTENDAHPVPAGGPETPNQAAQLAAGIELAYCQPYVAAYFNFLLWDEPDLARWQSGVLWASGGPKPSYGALRSVIADVKNHVPDCAVLAASRGSSVPAGGDGLIARLEWPSTTMFSSFNVVWRFSVEARTNVGFRAAIVGPARASSLRVSGVLKRNRPRTVQFPQRRLQPGEYRMTLTVSSSARPRAVTVTHAGPTFVVG